MKREIEYATTEQLYDVIELIKLQQVIIDSLQKQVDIMCCKTPEDLRRVLIGMNEWGGENEPEA